MTRAADQRSNFFFIEAEGGLVSGSKNDFEIEISGHANLLETGNGDTVTWVIMKFLHVDHKVYRSWGPGSAEVPS
jgi:hypothetical protein